MRKKTTEGIANIFTRALRGIGTDAPVGVVAISPIFYKCCEQKGAKQVP